MVKADDLIKQQKEREERKNITFEKIYNQVEKKIYSASSGNSYYTWYRIPEFLVGLPMYSLNDCNQYLQNKLNKSGFTIEFFEPNILLIKWFPNTK